ncbi:uncharacterized protein LOC121731064 isoform X2 [Aricia agestis]|uniref:uncharacterized protein LOC121731064 isoform X2 n=1 Tax=Aricia agestis TaxID=91739 RepID=UPI001C207B62|nr:uncharacterized protein LOC121731064 isoform X2 [Aricia agestis]
MHKLLCGLVILSCAICFTKGNQCWMEGVENWLLAVTVNIMDTDREVEVLRRTTENIEEIIDVTQGEALNRGPYLTMSLEDSSFVISTNAAFNTYENDETSLTIGSVVQFRCTSGSTSMLVITVNITDTNNHSPEFVPSNYEFTIAPPVPPGFLVTDCISDVITRDVDLTTYRIDYEIQGSDLFKIAYDESSTEPKNFKAILRTAEFIRTLPEPIVLRVRATDVDLTGNDPRSVDSTITIHANSEFEFPDEPIFSQAYYLASYTDTHLELQETISLRQGYDDQVTFSFDGDLKEYFQLVPSNNEVSFRVISAIPVEEYPDDGQIYLVVAAEREYTSGAMATVVVQFPRDSCSESSIRFAQDYYVGSYEDGSITLDPITLNPYLDDVILELIGDYSNYFQAYVEGEIIKIRQIEDAQVNLESNFLVLTLEASTLTSRAHTIIVLKIINDGQTTLTILNFSEAFYVVLFTESEGLIYNSEIVLSEGYDESVGFSLEGEDSEWFTVDESANPVVLKLTDSLPDEIIQNNSYLSFVIRASNGENVVTRATIIIEIQSDRPSEDRAAFDKVLYIGQFQENVVTHEAITVLNHDGSPVLLSGGYAQLFEATINTNGVVAVSRLSSGMIPADVTSIPLEMTAGLASAVLIINILSDGPVENTSAFDKILYIGQLQENVITHETITVLHHDGSPVILSGGLSQYFDATILNGVVTVSVISSVTILDGISSIPLEMTAGSATAVLVLNIITSEGPIENRATFDKVLYMGQVEGNTVTHEAISIINYDGSPVLFSGDYAQFFETTILNGVVTVTAPSSLTVPDGITNIPLEMTAGSATAVLVLSIITSEGPIENRFAFDKVLYMGQIEENTVTHEEITIINYDGSPVQLSGDYSQLFEAVVSNNIVTVTRVSSATIPADITNILLEITSGPANAVLALSVTSSGNPSENRASFDKVLYIGQLQENVVSHETITVFHHDGSPVILTGEYEQLFEASITNGVVTVSSVSSVTIPEDIASIPLELRVGEASAVLILSVTHSDQPVLPTVTFSSPSYTLRTDVSQTGVIGTVHATADNGEPITYTLLLENDHLRERLSMNSDGDISLSAPAASGGYNFQVQATAIVNRVSAVAEVSLWVEAVTVCDTDIVLHPLIVIERLEEEPHRDLVILNRQQYADCEFELTNHWPREQNWLYVDAEGLHARVIDREHESIAYMHVSQVQVEIVLHCENDSTRRKRSLDTHEYGSKSWILTDTILYNSRRSLVNLIVIDINDNAPIFVGKESEPIYVGYPTNELEDTILPRSLVELKATDADIGENAELLYWSVEENLAVAPTTGFVHVRQSALLEDNSRFTIYATDQNGRGLNGSIDIVVKLLDENHIAVVTINDAFLDDEQSIITDISTALGYDVKILKAAVVSTDTSDITRKKREMDNTGASLQLYVYGIEENNAVHVDQLTSDISNSDLTSVSIARVLSLEDHLLQICPVSRDTALLAATISLAVLLLLIVTMVTVREVLKRKQGQPNYEQFSDVNSLGSRNNSVPVLPKVESLERPKLNLDELRKSEKRLQDMLNEDRREPVEKKETEPANESIIDMPVPLTPEPVQQNMPIVIQSIDKLKDDDSDGDEYGEVQNNRRKSVVTFNENVEKIIHIEDRSASISSDSTDFEVYKF